SELVLLYENGPVHTANDLSLVWNDCSSDKASNLMFVDQLTENGVSNNLYDFLQAFFVEHPCYDKNDFYITGESYAGHYIPAFASPHYSTRKKYEGEYCYDLSIMEKFLNEKSVKDALGAMDIRFDLCNKNVSIALVFYLLSAENSKWVHAVEWSGRKDFEVALTAPFKVDGAKAGQMKSYRLLTLLRIYFCLFIENEVHNSGHMVPTG
ncbi:hypothetical protein CISIN_1g039388mg, partial [Citrus sinensis]